MQLFQGDHEKVKELDREASTLINTLYTVPVPFGMSHAAWHNENFVNIKFFPFYQPLL